MSDDRPNMLTLSPEAIFRGRVIALVVARLAKTGRVADAVRLIAASAIPTLQPGVFREVSARTIWRWWKIHQENGGSLHALEPKTRKPGKRRAISDALLDFFVDEKVKDPAVSNPAMIRKAEELGMIASSDALDRTTLWRNLAARGVVMGSGLHGPVIDSRRFAYTHRMAMVLADFKHFRAGPTGCRRLALYFIDDATRYVLGVLVTTAGESAKDVLTLLHQIVTQYGRMSMLFMDNGSGFKANVVEQVALNFKPSIAVVLGTPGYPEGHGKIERFNRSVKARVLRHLRKPGIDPDPVALTLRLQHDVEYYNTTHNEGVGASPKDKWDGDARPLQPVRDDADLNRIFTVRHKKASKVSNDHVIKIKGVRYEVPRGYAKQRVQVYRRVLEATKTRDALYIDHNGAMMRIHPVNLSANAHAKRARKKLTRTVSAQSPGTTSAAELAFERQLGPITAADGGYTDNQEF